CIFVWLKIWVFASPTAVARLPLGPGLMLGDGSWWMVDNGAPVMMLMLLCSSGWGWGEKSQDKDLSSVLLPEISALTCFILCNRV
ncbi:hypothetical protein PoB_003719300, partial [Plakobranchus ocellatus]